MQRHPKKTNANFIKELQENNLLASASYTALSAFEVQETEDEGLHYLLSFPVVKSCISMANICTSTNQTQKQNGPEASRAPSSLYAGTKRRTTRSESFVAELCPN